MAGIPKRYVSAILWTAVFVALFLYMYLARGYLFPYIEQRQMFMWDARHILERLLCPAGFAAEAKEFCLQFFLFPWCGALVSAALLTAVGIATQRITSRMNPRGGDILLWFVPVATQMFLLLDPEYLYDGIISYLLASAVFAAYLHIRASAGMRSVAASFMALALFWLAGPAAFFFALTVLAREAAAGIRRAPYALLPCLVVAAAAVAAVYAVPAIADLRRALLPDAYYNPMLPAPEEVRYAWIAMPLIAVAATLSAKRREPSRGRRIAETAVQAACAAALVAVMARTGDCGLGHDTVKLQKLDYLLRRHDWDAIEEECRAGATNTLHLFIQNIALCEKGELADRAFSFRQNGLEGLSLDWSDNNPFIFSLLSDMHYAVGNPSAAQETAFKKNSECMAVTGSYNPRMLVRLVQTSLIYGGRSGYATAEKYISLLEKTLFYRREASSYRRFLYDDAAVEADPRLGAERVNMPNIDLVYAAESDPERLSLLAPTPMVRRTVEHLCVGRLLNADLDGFAAAVRQCLGTPAMPALAECYAEALLIRCAVEGLPYDSVPASAEAKARFQAFQTFAAEHYGRGDLSALMKRSYGDSYMYYYMFVKE